MKGKYEFTAYVPMRASGLIIADEVEVEGIAYYNFTEGRPAVMYLRNGDPGYPADPPEIDFTSIEIFGHATTALNCPPEYRKVDAGDLWNDLCKYLDEHRFEDMVDEALGERE